MDWIANSSVLLIVEVILAISVIADIVRRERLGQYIGAGKYLIYGWCVNCILFAASAFACLNFGTCVVPRGAVNVWSALVDLQGLASILIYLHLFVGKG